MKRSIATVPMLEKKVADLNEWLRNYAKIHPAYKAKEQQRDYYLDKLCEMDDHNLTTIEI